MSRTDLNAVIGCIKEKVPLSKIVGTDVVLRKHGREFVGQCPFHLEKTASFFVNDDKGTFYCFGCGASGDLIEYIVKKDKITFIQAIEKLAAIAGVKLPEKASYGNNFENHQKILQKAVEFFKEALFANKKAMEYCEQRGIDRKMIEMFSLGYAEDNRPTRFLDHLRKTGFSDQDISSSGLFVCGNHGLSERFRDRIMFPVFNKNGWPIAFGARSLSNGVVPKYLNSPESELFRKKEVLYGYNIASKNSSKDKQIVVVEGYIDVITMHKFGFDTSVASMGTSFSSEHLAKIWRYSDEPVVCLDGDGAGYKAMVRLSTMTMQYLQPGKSLRFCILPKDADPDSFLREKGSDILRSLIKNSMNLVDFFWDHRLKEFYEIGDRTPEKIAKWEKDTGEILKDIQDPEIRKLYKAEIKDRIYNVLHRKISDHKRETPIQRSIRLSVNVTERMLTREALLLYTIVVRPSVARAVAEHLSSIIFSDHKFMMVQDFILASLDEPDFAKFSDTDTISLIKTIGKENCDIERLDEGEVLELWHSIYNVGFCRRSQIDDVVSAKEDYAKEPNQTTWERLRAIKMDSLYR
jgi:DNA primase